MCNFAECECGDRMIFSKTERFHDPFAKSSPIWIFGMTLLFCLFSWRKLSPKLVIPPAYVLFWDHLCQFVFDNILRGDQTHKGFF